MTANMTNRDAKGKFTKAPAETVSFKIGDHVQKIGSTHRSMTPNGTHGVVDALDPIGVAWDGHHRQTYAHCAHEHIQPAPAPFKIGDRVRVKASVTRPEHGWSDVTHDSIGTIVALTLRNGKDAGVQVDFPSDTGWNSPVDELELAPAPCPFKVGDRVERVAIRPIGHGNIRHGSSGTVTECAPNYVTVRWDMGQGYRDYTDRGFSYIRKVEDAPAKPCRVDVDLLIYERDGLLDEVSRLKTEAKERANTYSQNVQSLKDELTSAHDATNIEHSALLDARKQLEDIAALRRSMAIFAITGSREGYGPFNNAIDAVLEGRVA